jgi:broad specificity phosphatase PhoE
MKPPWIERPDIPFLSIGWKMGWGEVYMKEFTDWFVSLTAEERAAYEREHPQPDSWPDFWRRFNRIVARLSNSN